MTLTDAQARTLSAMQTLERMGIGRAEIRRQRTTGQPRVGIERVRESTLTALTDKGYVQNLDGSTYALTPAGAEALAAWEAGR